MKKFLIIILAIIAIILFSYYLYYEGIFEKKIELNLSYSIPLETSPPELNLKSITDIKDAFRYLINKSQKSIYIAGLYFTSKINWRIRRDLKRAIKRGVKIKFLLQDSDFSRNELRKLHITKYPNVEVQFINIAPLGQKKWGQFHNKYAIFDKKYAIVGSANFSYPAFNHNVEIDALIVDKDIVYQLTQIFFQDLRYGKYKIFPIIKPAYFNFSNLILRPIFLAESAPREINIPELPDISDVIEFLLKNAKKEVVLEVYAFTSNKINYPLFYRLMCSAIKKNITIKLLINSECYEKNKYVKFAIDELKKLGIKIKKLKIKEITNAEYSAMHSKVLIVDKKYVLLGSSNWTKSGMLENREIAIVSSQTQFVYPLYKKFYKDWNSKFSEIIQ